MKKTNYIVSELTFMIQPMFSKLPDSTIWLGIWLLFFQNQNLIIFFSVKAQNIYTQIVFMTKEEERNLPYYFREQKLGENAIVWIGKLCNYL